MEEKVAVVSIVVENEEAVGALNALLHEYSPWIIGRMGLPYRPKKVNIICVAMDAPADRVASLAAALSALEGVSATATCARA